MRYYLERWVPLKRGGQVYAISLVVEEVTVPRAAEKSSEDAAKGAERILRKNETKHAEADVLAKLNDLSSRLWSMRNLREGLDEMLAAICELLGAELANVQMFDRERGVLRIVSQRGFRQEFLDFFEEVSAEDDSACGQALRAGKRIIIEDVETDESFAPFRDDGARGGLSRGAVDSPHRP